MLSKDVQVAVSLFALATAQSLPAFVAAHNEFIEGHCVLFFSYLGMHYSEIQVVRSN